MMCSLPSKRVALAFPDRLCVGEGEFTLQIDTQTGVAFTSCAVSDDLLRTALQRVLSQLRTLRNQAPAPVQATYLQLGLRILKANRRVWLSGRVPQQERP